MYNVCKEIRCPYAYKSGCDRYSVAAHCHLLYPSKGQRREGLNSSEYWLFAEETDSTLDINQLKDENEVFLKNDENTKCRAELGVAPFEQSSL